MVILKKELKKVFQDNKMIAVVQNNNSNAEDMMILKHRLHKHSITVKFIPNQVTLSTVSCLALKSLFRKYVNHLCFRYLKVKFCLALK